MFWRGVVSVKSGIHCKAKGEVRRENCSVGSSRGADPRQDPRPVPRPDPKVG